MDTKSMLKDGFVKKQVVLLIDKDLYSGNHVQILTKNGTDATRDFDLLDEHDWFSISYSGYETKEFYYGANCEPGTSTPLARVKALELAKELGINTWVSCEPVMNDADVLKFIERTSFVDLWKVGKLNKLVRDVSGDV